MENATIKEMAKGYFRIKANKGYVIRDTNTLRTYRDVTTRNIEQFEVIEDNEQNN